MGTLTIDQQEPFELLLDQVGPLRLRNCPLTPTARQEAYLRLQVLEALFGGAAGGGKSVAMLMDALAYSDVPGYDALLLRPTLSELELPGGLIDLAHSWLRGSKAVWSGDSRTWTFPGPGKSGSEGARLVFGYLDGQKDVHRYAGTEFSFVGFDELTRFESVVYQRMFRVLCQPDQADNLPAGPDGLTLAGVPVRARATSNPGGPGHGWVRAYFVDPATRPEGVVFVPSRLEDNPHLDPARYRAALSVLSGAERARLLHGDWDVPDDCDIFLRDWFVEINRKELPRTVAAVRFWDFAASEPGPGNPDPDWTVGLKLERDSANTFYVTDIVRVRKSAGTVEQIVKATAVIDGRSVEIWLEQEPAAAGKSVTDRFKREVLRGYSVHSRRASGSKEIAARVVASDAENGLIKIVRSRDSQALLDELAAFPHGSKDDQVDALAGAHRALTDSIGGGCRTFVPRGNIDDIADRARVREGRPRRRSAAIEQARIDRERDATARLAGELGLPYYDSQTGGF